MNTLESQNTKEYLEQEVVIWTDKKCHSQNPSNSRWSSRQTIKISTEALLIIIPSKDFFRFCGARKNPCPGCSSFGRIWWSPFHRNIFLVGRRFCVKLFKSTSVFISWSRGWWEILPEGTEGLRTTQDSTTLRSLGCISTMASCSTPWLQVRLFHLPCWRQKSSSPVNCYKTIFKTKRTHLVSFRSHFTS